MEQKEKMFSPLVLVLGEPSGTTRLEEYRAGEITVLDLGPVEGYLTFYLF